MPLEPVSVTARLLPLSALFVAGFALLAWDRRVTHRADKRFVGSYELLSEIGRGGMSIVYRARDTSLPGRPIVALKILNPDRVRDASSMRRFVREAEICSHLRHPGIVTMLASGECRVLDRGTWESTAYLAMEFVDGTSLAPLISASDSLPLVRMIEILRDAAVALSAAHTMGVLHRDIKPDNILLSRGGVVKLADFGIAAVLTRPSQTEAGFLVGTLAYLPPERVKGKVEDPRGDIYSFGVTMYEAICGRRPFDDKNMTTAELLRAVIEEAPPAPAALRPDLPPRLSDLIARCLAKRPEQRPSSARSVADELQNILRLLRGEVDLPVPSGPGQALDMAEGRSSMPNARLSAPDNRSSMPNQFIADDPFARATLELPPAPSPPEKIPSFDEAAGRETMDLPRSFSNGTDPSAPD